MAQPDLLGIVVRDMATALKFYRLLGLDIPSNMDAEPHVEYVLPGGFRLAWDSLEMVKGIDPNWVEPTGQRMTLAFKCENAEEVDTLYNRVIENGYGGHTLAPHGLSAQSLTVRCQGGASAGEEPWDAFWGQRYAVVVDPVGNSVDLFA